MYATRADMEDLYGQEQIALVSTRYGEDAPNEGSIESALADASALIDTHIGTRYTLPLPQAVTAPVLRRPCVDIAIYYLASTADVLTEQIENRFKHAKSVLQKLGNGTIKLALDRDGDGKAEAQSNVITVEGPPRAFSRSKLRGL